MAESPATAELGCDGYSATAMIHSPGPELGVTLYTPEAEKTPNMVVPVRPFQQPLHHLPVNSPSQVTATPPPPPPPPPSSLPSSITQPPPVGYISASNTTPMFSCSLSGTAVTTAECVSSVATTLPPPSPLVTPHNVYPTYHQSSASYLSNNNPSVNAVGCKYSYTSAFGPNQHFPIGFMNSPPGSHYNSFGQCFSLPSAPSSGLSFAQNTSLSIFPPNFLAPNSYAGTLPDISSSPSSSSSSSSSSSHNHNHYRYHQQQLSRQPNSVMAFHYGPPSLQGLVDDSGNPRPPYSFSALIAMAILSSQKSMLTLPEIYNYISQKFPYYRKEDKPWKNAIRHNLSLNKCFQKAPREDGYHGKGNYWIIDPACDHVLENGSFRSPTKKKKSKKVKAKLSMDTDRTGSIGTHAVLNPQTSVAEILIPPIENTAGTSTGSSGQSSSTSSTTNSPDSSPNENGFCTLDTEQDRASSLPLHSSSVPSENKPRQTAHSGSQPSMSNIRVVPEVSFYSSQVGKMVEAEDGGSDLMGSKALNFPVERLLS